MERKLPSKRSLIALAKTLNSNGLATIAVPLFSICCRTTALSTAPEMNKTLIPGRSDSITDASSLPLILGIIMSVIRTSIDSPDLAISNASAPWDARSTL
jgi:hypothetical protein